MASRNLICNANGNLTGASTFALTEAGASATTLIRNTTTTIAASTNVTSSLFTVTNTDVIDGVLLWLQAGASPTGTIKVELVLSGVVQGTGCTINKSDLPSSTNSAPSPVLFKMAGNATGDGTANWGIKITTTGTVATTIAIASATTTNYTRALRRTTAGTPAATDDLYICGEWTAAATVTTRTVTMDQTATTAYGSGVLNTTAAAGGGIHVGNNGAMTFSTSINSVLRVNGDVNVWASGTWNQGTSGTPVPTTQTSVLEFVQNSLDGDFGFIANDNSTVNIYGAPRTAGKSVVNTLLTTDTGTNLLATQGTTAAPTITLTNATNATASLDPTAISLVASAITDNVTSGNHQGTFTTGGSVTGVTQTASVWLARGSGTNNRFVRIQLGNSGGTMTNGFFADVDLQAGTIGTCTAVGNGTATSSAIVALGTGFVCTIVGKASSAAQTPLFGLLACSASTTISYAGDTTQNFLYYGQQVFTAAAVPSLTLNVSSDTGWLTSDVIAMASTNRAAADCEILSISGNAGSSSIALNKYTFSNHSGTSPTQAEIILLTRNVKIRSTSNTLMMYFQATALATVNVQWTEFYYIGAAASFNKGGLALNGGTTTNAKSVTFCSVHDTKVCGVFFSGVVTSMNVTFSNNTMWNMGTTTGPGCQISGSVTNTDWTFDSNILIKTGNGNGWTLLDVGGTFTNNTVAGAAAAGFAFSEANATLGTFSGNTAHSNTTIGCSIAAAGINGTLTTPTCWRQTTTGMTLGSIGSDLTLVSPVMFGNTTDNILVSTNASITINGTPILSGDTTFSTTNGIRYSATEGSNIVIDNGDFSTVSGIKTAHTNDVNIAGTYPVDVRAVLRNTKLGAATQVATPSNLSNNGYIATEKLGQTAGSHKTWQRNGTVETDATTFNTAAPSMLMTPTSASLKLASAPMFQGIQAAVASGTTVTIAVYIRKSASYNGNQPRLMQRANPALGQNSDVVLATYSSGTGAWNQLSATSSSATDAGVWEFFVDCDGTAGAINVDDWSVTGDAALIGDVKYWFNGVPMDVVTSPKGVSRARAFAGFA